MGSVVTGQSLQQLMLSTPCPYGTQAPQCHYPGQQHSVPRSKRCRRTVLNMMYSIIWSQQSQAHALQGKAGSAQWRSRRCHVPREHSSAVTLNKLKPEGTWEAWRPRSMVWGRQRGVRWGVLSEEYWNVWTESRTRQNKQAQKESTYIWPIVLLGQVQGSTGKGKVKRGSRTPCSIALSLWMCVKGRVSVKWSLILTVTSDWWSVRAYSWLIWMIRKWYRTQQWILWAWMGSK